MDAPNSTGIVSVWVSRHWPAGSTSSDRWQPTGHDVTEVRGINWVSGHLREFRVIAKTKISAGLTVGIILGLTRLPMLLLE